MFTPTKKIMIVEDDPEMLYFIKNGLLEQGYKMFTFENAESAIDWLNNEKCDLILLDIKLPGMSGIEAIDHIQKRSDACIIVITAYGDKKLSLQAISKGAYDYFTKPFDLEELEITVKRALEKQRLQKEIFAQKQKEEGKKTFQFSTIVGKGNAVKKVLEQISMIADTEATVLILGETGTGKELIAQAIHENSARRDKPFIKLNCVAIPEGLIETELFGHEKGSFTGAINKKIGKFELADKGTILLDEIGDMSIFTQAKILRILQEKEFERVGGIQSIRVDVRIIASTNKNLFDEVKQKRFREDLFYRLNIITIFLPPLRERMEDIPLLCDSFIRKFLGEKRQKVTISNDALAILGDYQWPGNIRELENTIERAVIMLKNGGEVITPSHLPPHIREMRKIQPLQVSSEAMSLDESISLFEKEQIIEALYKTRGIQSLAAKTLGITERSLWHRIKKYKINPQNIKKQQKM